MENENLAHGSGRGKVIGELLRGRELTNKLRNILNESGDIDNINGSTTPCAEDLLKEVLTTFTNSLLFLNNNPTSEGSDLQLTKSEDSLESNCKSTSIVKERRGCYKRRYLIIDYYLLILLPHIQLFFLLYEIYINS